MLPVKSTKLAYTRNGEKWARFLFWELWISIKFDAIS
jgi:hypothetical protein